MLALVVLEQKTTECRCAGFVYKHRWWQHQQVTCEDVCFKAVNKLPILFITNVYLIWLYYYPRAKYLEVLDTI